MQLSRFILTRILGWTMDPCEIRDDKFIVLGVPHTSIWDFAIAFLYLKAHGFKPGIMIKKEAFIGPVGWFLRALGGFPMDRAHPTAIVKSIVSEMNCRPRFCLGIAPEGTRKAVKSWKTGFHFIARATSLPVYLGYYDWKHKKVGSGKRFEVSNDAKADLVEIQKYYKALDVDGLHPGHLAYLDEV